MALDVREGMHLDTLQDVQSRCLLYPSAGTDWETPLMAFHPWIESFWFVDTSHKDSAKLKELCDSVDLIETNALEGRTIKGNPAKVEIRSFQCSLGSKQFDVHLCRGKGYDTFRLAFKDCGKGMSVFFHRGDSPGEGGSNFHWLHRKRLRDVLKWLEPGGLIVSDGSLAIPQLAMFHYTSESGESAFRAAKPFERFGRAFSCVGYLDKRNGPTLVWKVN
jgi:hypothetical protein